MGKYFGLDYAMKSGVGSISLTVRDSVTNATVTVGTIVAVNAMGDVYRNGTLIAGARTLDGKYLQNTIATLLSLGSSTHKVPFATAATLVCVVTDATLNKAGAKKSLTNGS